MLKHHPYGTLPDRRINPPEMPEVDPDAVDEEISERLGEILRLARGSLRGKPAGLTGAIMDILDSDLVLTLLLNDRVVRRAAEDEIAERAGRDAGR